MTSAVGHGVSLKASHYAQLLEAQLPVSWAEAVTENFLGRGGRPSAVLERVRRDAQVILHGVSMSLGGLDPLDASYFRSLRRLRQRIDAAFVSDHVCFGTVDGHHGHDLWPLPLHDESLQHMIERVKQAQDMLDCQLVVENVSRYVEYEASNMSEASFIAQLLDAADAGMLLDVNNVYVSAHNLGFDARAYIDALPAKRVRYYHLAGHSEMGTLLLDDHGSSVCDAVWDLYEYTVRRIGARPTIVEWDTRVPPLAGLIAESARAQQHETHAMGAPTA